MDRCGECGFTYDVAAAEGSGGAIRAGVSEFAGLLRRTDVGLGVRPEPGIWSLLEYGCHLRDVLISQRERVLLARRSELPFAEPMGRDERVEHDGYAEQDPVDVARQLSDAALLFANVLDRLGPADWERALVYTYPERRERALRWVATHTLHEVRHHLMDVRRQLDAGADAEAGRW
ncbi:DinB family protein [Actinopolymorpha pittospori]